jgi:hypothetical protein
VFFQKASGIWHLGSFTLGWLAGSVAAGLLYEHSRTGLIAFSLMAQLAAVPFFILAAKAHNPKVTVR